MGTNLQYFKCLEKDSNFQTSSSGQQFSLCTLKQAAKSKNSIFVVAFYIAPTQYGYFPSLKVKEDLRHPFVNYYSHKWAHQ
jgi:hypothetical protein